MKSVQLILMIGLTKESGHWNHAFIAYIKKLYQTDDLVMIDIPGTGYYRNEKTPFRIPNIIRKTRERYFPQLNMEKERMLISISLGSMLATEWARQYPDDFQALVIINSSYRRFNRLIHRVQPKAMVSFVKIFLTRNPIRKEENILNLCSNNSSVREHVLPDWLAINRARPVMKRNMLRQTIAGAIYKPRRKPKTRLLIIASRHDRLANYRCSIEINRRWGGDLLIIRDPAIGHGIHIDAPELLAEVIHTWYINPKTSASPQTLTIDPRMTGKISSPHPVGE